MEAQKRKFIRDFFIKYHNLLTSSFNYVEAADRGNRYDQLLSHYMEVMTDNRCQCFNSIEDVEKALIKNIEQDRNFILKGVDHGCPRDLNKR